MAEASLCPSGVASPVRACVRVCQPAGTCVTFSPSASVPQRVLPKILPTGATAGARVAPHRPTSRKATQGLPFCC